MKPRLRGLSANGLHAMTNFYPGILALREYEDLPERRIGWMGKDFSAIAAKLILALGIGKGCCDLRGHPRGSHRGRVVRLRKVAARVVQAEYAIVVTEPVYSATKHYQVIVPVVSARGRAAVEPALIVSAEPLISLFGPAGGLIVVPTVVSVWHPEHILGLTQYVVSKNTMPEIEARLKSWFGI